MQNTVAIILARQNSKGIPLKNLALVGGQSLLTRAVLAAEKSSIFTHIIISTDGDLIAEEAKKYDSVTLIRRPEYLANDVATSISGVLHALDELGIYEGSVCLLQPTSPLRSEKHIIEAYNLFLKQEKQGSVVSVCEAEHHPYKFLLKDEQDSYQPVRNLVDLESPRQTLPKAYRPNGAIYFNEIKLLREKKAFFFEPIALYSMSANESVDIDTPQDLIYANQILEKV